MRAGLLILAIGAAMTLLGCSDARVAAPDITTPRPPDGTHPTAYPAAGVSLQVPNSWRAEQGTSPLVASIASGTATVAIWRYPRTEPLPKKPKTLRAAKDALVGAAHKRDRTLRISRAAVVRFHGRPAPTSSPTTARWWWRRWPRRTRSRGCSAACSRRSCAR